MNQSFQYLDSVRQLSRDKVPLAFELVLNHGKQWEASKHHPGGAMGACYKNALDYACKYDLLYVEGWAVSGKLIPIEHAWCMNSDGGIIDPTWENGSDYFGVVFEPEWVLDVFASTGYAGILCNLQSVRNVRKPPLNIEEMRLFLREAVQPV